jgi:hypothetical protein
MPELILKPTYHVQDTAGMQYDTQVHGEQRADGTWEGWIIFVPASSTGPVLRTNRETTQANHAALVYWATGLEPVYYEGALGRAHAEE